MSDLQIIMLPALVFLLAIAGNSDAAHYCICNEGLTDEIYQMNIDYACGAGADCTPTMQNGACFQPNTVKDHCDFAVNSYYQRNGQKQGTCCFSNTANVVQEPPPAISECVPPSRPRAVKKRIINLSLSIKTTVPTAIAVIVIGLLLLLFRRLEKWRSRKEPPVSVPSTLDCRLTFPSTVVSPPKVPVSEPCQSSCHPNPWFLTCFEYEC